MKVRCTVDELSGELEWNDGVVEGNKTLKKLLDHTNRFTPKPGEIHSTTATRNGFLWLCDQAFDEVEVL